jgi:hypothetical protein
MESILLEYEETSSQEDGATSGPRKRLVADFLVAAHAQVRTGRLLTRDRGFFRRYFTELDVVEPT